MRRCWMILCLLLIAFASGRSEEKPVVLMSGLGELHHPVSTKNAEAQQFFDQGLRLIYAFNHDEAARSFHRAAELDRQLAMAWWGVALAVGPNYNLPVDAEHEKIAVDAMNKAKALSASAPQTEKDYIQALAKRFSSDANPDYHQLNVAYSQAMRALWQKYPDDLDAGTLYADSLMNLRPWKLWNADGTPAEGTTDIVATLESVLRRDPSHIGAMHLYIHAVEASPNPERALPYAERIAALTPNARHLVHMPSHTYIRTGYYDGARVQNEDAAKVDEQYIRESGAQGIYPLMYYSHNLHFLAIAAGMQGRCADAEDAAGRLAANVQPALSQMPTLKAFWLYGHGIALAAKGKTADAEADEKQLAAIEKATPREDIFMPPVENHTWQILQIADDVLSARIAAAKGDSKAAVALLQDAVMNQDQLNYNEPQDWYYPVRESLGGTLLLTGEAKGAEQVFRDDLAKNPRNPRSLFGLAEALKKQGRDYDAAWVQKQFETAWQGADVSLSVESL